MSNFNGSMKIINVGTTYGYNCSGVAQQLKMNGFGIVAIELQ